MRKKRQFTEGAFYHVTSRTNDKIRVFENKLGRKIMLITLQDASNQRFADKYHFLLTNFCIMPTHIHLLIKPKEGTSLNIIMQSSPADWKASGAYYKNRNIKGLLDYDFNDRQPYVKLLFPIPPIVAKLLPPAQMEKILKYFGAYAEAIDKIYKIIPTIPDLGESAFLKNLSICLHYFTETTDYFIYEYDGEDTMYGLERFNVYPAKTVYRKFSLSNLKNIYLLELNLSWEV